MTTSKIGTFKNPLELREGATSRFYIILGGGYLAMGETVSGTPTATATAGALANTGKNAGALTLGGVSYAASEVLLSDLSGISIGDLVEVVFTFTTVGGPAVRTDKRSVFIRGVDNYT